MQELPSGRRRSVLHFSKTGSFHPKCGFLPYYAHLSCRPLPAPRPLSSSQNAGIGKIPLYKTMKICHTESNSDSAGLKRAKSYAGQNDRAWLGNRRTFHIFEKG